MRDKHCEMNRASQGAQKSTCQCRRLRRCGFHPWVGKIPWRRAWQPSPVFLPGESPGQRSLVGCSPWGLKVCDVTEHTYTHNHTKVLIRTYRVCVVCVWGGGMGSKYGDDKNTFSKIAQICKKRIFLAECSTL